VLLAEFIGLRWHDETALLLARRWSQAIYLRTAGSGGARRGRRAVRTA
jgi:hypothetical protein